MTPRLTALASLLLAVMLTSAAAASREDEDACRPDVFRLCASQIPDEHAIVACLNRATPSLSPACRAVIAPVEAQAASPVHGKRVGRTR